MLIRFQDQNLRIIAFSAVIFFAAGCSKEPSEEEILKKAIEHQTWNEYDDALSSYKMLIERFPKSADVPEALFAMGVVYQSKGDFTKAVATYKRLAEDYPDHPTASGAAYLRALLLRRELKDSVGAQKAYEEFLKRYPNAPMAGSARIELDSLRVKTPAKKHR